MTRMKRKRLIFYKTIKFHHNLIQSLLDLCIQLIASCLPLNRMYYKRGNHLLLLEKILMINLFKLFIRSPKIIKLSLTIIIMSIFKIMGIQIKMNSSRMMFINFKIISLVIKYCSTKNNFNLRVLIIKTYLVDKILIQMRRIFKTKK